jgi:hypothetical protein
MGAQFVTLRQQQGEADGMVAVAEYWYLTEDKARVVREGDPDGRWLWASPGTDVPRADALRLGALKAAAPETEPVAEVEAEAESEHEHAGESEVETEPAVEPEVAEAPEPRTKSRAKPADKSRKPAADK